MKTVTRICGIRIGTGKENNINRTQYQGKISQLKIHRIAIH